MYIYISFDALWEFRNLANMLLVILSGGKPNSHTELEVVCLGGGYHLEKQVGVAFEVLQKNT